MTGSGKTGLGVVLIEEVLRAGLPALLIDPKGDLTNLCLTFPDLAPADFRPWIDEAPGQGGRRSRPTSSPPSRRRRGRTGLAGWGFGPEQIAALRAATRLHDLHARARSPACRSTSSARCRCPATDDAEVVGDEIEGYVVGPARPRRHRGRPAVEPRAHPARQPDPALVVGRARRSTCRRSSGMSSSRRSASSACSSSTSSSRRTTARSWR